MTPPPPSAPVPDDALCDALIRAAYETLLGREADAAGLISQKEALKDFADIPELVGNFITSAEAQLRQVSGLDLARFLERAAQLPAGEDGAAEALHAALVQIVQAHLPEGITLDTDLSTAPAPAHAPAEEGPALYLARQDRSGRLDLTALVIGAEGGTLTLFSEQGEEIEEAPLESAFAVVEITWAHGEDDAQGFSVTVPSAGLLETVKLRDRIFTENMDRNLTARAFGLADAARFQFYAPPKAGSGLIDARLAALYGLHHNKQVDAAYCARNPDRILSWYVNAWPQYGECSGQLSLSEAQLDYLREDVFGPEVLGYRVSRHIFHFARHIGMLDAALNGRNGLIDAYYQFFKSEAYKHLAYSDLVPVDVVNALASPVSAHNVTLNQFWLRVLNEELGDRSVADITQQDLLGICAEKFSYALLNGIFEKLIPAEWFRLYQAGHAAADPDRTEAPLPSRSALDPMLHDKVRDQALAARAMLREDPLSDIFRNGWRKALNARVAQAGTAGQDGHPVTLIGHGGGSGLAKNMKMFRNTFKQAGLAFRGLDVDSMKARDFSLGPAQERLPHDVNLFAVNADRFSRAVTSLPSLGAAPAANVGFFLWETTRAPKAHRYAKDFVDEIWVPTEFVRDVYLDLFDGDVNVVNVRKHISVPKTVSSYPLANLGIRESDFVFVNVSDFDSSITRKNPLPVVRAFRKAFPDDPDVRLVLKIRKIDPAHWSNTENYWDRVLEAMGDDPRITILTGDLPEDDYWGLLDASDCFVTLHRSEGFGYGAAHAMLMDVPVITTDFSGTQDFCTPETAFLVEAEQIPVKIGDMLFSEDLGIWAEADVDSAAQQMQAVRAGGAPVANAVAAARSKIETDYAFDRFLETIKGRMQALGG